MLGDFLLIWGKSLDSSGGNENFSLAALVTTLLCIYGEVTLLMRNFLKNVHYNLDSLPLVYLVYGSML